MSGDRVRVVGLLSVVFVAGCASAHAGAPARSATSAKSAPPATSLAASMADVTQANPDADSDDDDGDVEVASNAAAPAKTQGPCTEEMALVTDGARRFCVDKWEASLVESQPDGSESPYPHYLPVDGHAVRAVSRPGVFPQGYISEVQAEDACRASSKRLCRPDEWRTACMGPAKTTFPYGDARRPGVCHDTGKSAVVAVFGAKAVAESPVYTPPPQKTAAAGSTKSKPKSKKKGAKAKAASHGGKAASSKKTARKSSRPASISESVWTKLNDPRLGEVEGTLAKTGDHEECVNPFGVFDMVGNLHEWVATDASVPHGTFQGGYYLDTSLNGDGCNYKTTAHAHEYHDYSTGFRCCADASE
jgi:formylglycine-generating enzyme required for sulfatase activity